MILDTLRKVLASGALALFVFLWYPIDTQAQSTQCNILSFTSDKQMVQSGGSTTLRLGLNGLFPWEIEAISGDGSASPAQGNNSFGVVSTGEITQTTTYKLSCGNDLDNPDDFAFLVVSAPTAPVCTGPATSRSGETVSFSAYGGDNNIYDWSSPNSNPATFRGQIFNTTFTNTTSGPVTRTVTVTSGGLSATCPITVNPLTLSTPTCTLSANPDRGNVPFTSTITWTAQNAASCVATGAWASSGYQFRDAAGGSQSFSVTSPGTHTNGLTCYNATNTAWGECSVQVTSDQIATISITGSKAYCEGVLGNYNLTVVSTRDSFFIRHVTAGGQSGNVTGVESPTTVTGRVFTNVGAVADNARFELVNANTNQIMGIYSVGSTGCQTSTTSVPPPTIQFSSSASSVNYNGSVTLSWSTTGAVYCDINGQPIAGNQLASGSRTYSNITTFGTQRYTMTCNSGTGGGTASKSIDVNVIQPYVPPAPLAQSGGGGTGQITYNTSGNCSMSVSLTAINTHPSSIRPPYQFAGTINATIPGAGGGGGGSIFGASVSCQVSASGVNLIRGTNWWGYGGGTLGVDADFSQPNGSVTYTVGNCFVYSGGSVNPQNCSATANVSYPPISAPADFTFTSDPNNGNVPRGGTAVLYWSTASVSSCTASGDWSGTKAPGTNMSQTITNITTFPRYYYLSCTATNGATLPTKTIVIRELEAMPTIRLTASPSSIYAGQSVTVSWEVTNAVSCEYTNGTAEWRATSYTNPNSNKQIGDVSNAPSTTFTMRCTNASNRTVEQSVTVNVAPNNTPPDITFFSNPASVDNGQSATLHWRVQNASSCSSGGDAPWGTPSRSIVSNSQCVTPSVAGCENYPITNVTSDKNFSLTCTSPTGQTATRYATILVNDPPPPVVLPPVVSLTATPDQGASPLTSTLSWVVSNNATSCVASGGRAGWPGSKTQLVSGNEVIGGISTPTTFTLTCSNSAGSGSASVTTTIVNPTNGNLNVVMARGGTVTSNAPYNGDINCGGSNNSCSRSYPAGTTVTLTATRESAQWEFVGWQGACRGNGTCTVYIRGNNTTETVTPVFVIKPIIYKEF